MKTIDKNYEGIYQNGKDQFVYDGDLYIDGDTTIEIELVVNGNLDVRGSLVAKNIEVTRCLAVGGDFVANGNVICRTLAAEANATIHGNFTSDSFWINGNLTVTGDTVGRNGISTIFGSLTTTNLIIDRLYAGGDWVVKGKIYTPLQGGLFK